MILPGVRSFPVEFSLLLKNTIRDSFCMNDFVHQYIETTVLTVFLHQQMRDLERSQLAKNFKNSCSYVLFINDMDSYLVNINTSNLQVPVSKA